MANSLGSNPALTRPISTHLAGVRYHPFPKISLLDVTIFCDTRPKDQNKMNTCSLDAEALEQADCLLA